MGPLPPPVGRQRRVQTFAAEQGAQATSCRRRGFGFLQDALLIFSGVGPPLRLATTSESGREASIESAPTLAVAPLRCGSRRSPSLRSATAKPSEDQTPREFPFISSFFFLALLIN